MKGYGGGVNPGITSSEFMKTRSRPKKVRSREVSFRPSYDASVVKSNFFRRSLLILSFLYMEWIIKKVTDYWLTRLTYDLAMFCPYPSLPVTASCLNYWVILTATAVVRRDKAKYTPSRPELAVWRTPLLVDPRDLVDHRDEAEPDGRSPSAGPTSRSSEDDRSDLWIRPCQFPLVATRQVQTWQLSASIHFYCHTSKSYQDIELNNPQEQPTVRTAVNIPRNGYRSRTHLRTAWFSSTRGKFPKIPGASPNRTPQHTRDV